METQAFHPFDQWVIVRDNGAALTGGDVLGGVKTHHLDVTEGAETRTIVCGADGMGTVLHHPQSVFVRQGVKGVKIHRKAGEMDRHDGLRPRRDRPLQLTDIHIECVGMNIDQHGPATGKDDGVQRGHKSECRRDDLIALIQANRL